VRWRRHSRFPKIQSTKGGERKKIIKKNLVEDDSQLFVPTNSQAETLEKKNGVERTEFIGEDTVDSQNRRCLFYVIITTGSIQSKGGEPNSLAKI